MKSCSSCMARMPGISRRIARSNSFAARDRSTEVVGAPQAATFTALAGLSGHGSDSGEAAQPPKERASRGKAEAQRSETSGVEAAGRLASRR
jgi:hypothetical protein